MFIINAKNLGLAGGLVWGLFILLMTWLCLFSGYGFSFLTFMADLYPGYSISFLGSFVGFIYGFIYAFVFFYVLAAIYNFIEH